MMIAVVVVVVVVTIVAWVPRAGTAESWEDRKREEDSTWAARAFFLGWGIRLVVVVVVVVVVVAVVAHLVKCKM